MAENIFPKQLDKFWTVVLDAIFGLHQHEVAIGVKQNTEAVMAAALLAAQGAENAFQAGRGEKGDFSAAIRAADAAGKAFIGKAKRQLINSLGSRWTAAWAVVGYPAPSLALPSTIAERQALLQSFATYFTANPGKENAPENVTAVEATARFDALKSARNGRQDQGLNALKQTRDVAVAELRTRMRGLVDELGQLLPDDSPLWHEFGLNAPADPETPETPADLTLLPATPGHVLAQWPKALRADRYQVFRKLIGTDTNFVHVTTVTGLEASFNTLPTGATVQVEVRAVNAAGESAFTAPHQIVVP